MTKPLLMTDENPNGWKLEELLQQIRNELDLKTQKVANIDHPTAKGFQRSNEFISQMLVSCEHLQRLALSESASNPIPKELLS